jgi:hypothetical protein
MRPEVAGDRHDLSVTAGHVVVQRDFAALAGNVDRMTPTDVHAGPPALDR